MLVSDCLFYDLVYVEISSVFCNEISSSCNAFQRRCDNNVCVVCENLKSMDKMFILKKLHFLFFFDEFSDQNQNQRPKKPPTSRVNFECYGGETTDDEPEDFTQQQSTRSTNPFRAPFSPHEVCGISDTLASFSLNGHRQQQGFTTDEEDDDDYFM